jgi:hypothetical protein
LVIEVLKRQILLRIEGREENGRHATPCSIRIETDRPRAGAHDDRFASWAASIR